MVIIAPVVLTVVIVARIAEQPDSYTSWAVFAALLISGVTTVLQTVRVGRIGAGHVLIMGTSGAFIAVRRRPVHDGEPHRRLVAVSVRAGGSALAASPHIHAYRRRHSDHADSSHGNAPVFDMLTEAPDGASSAAAPATALATLAVIAALVLRAPPGLRLWSPLIGIVAGCSVAAFFGLYDARQVLEAPWIGVPLGSWPGLDLTPGSGFWALLPAFVVVTLVGAIETIGDGVAIQRVSRRRPRATDFRVVQGALNADGVGNLLSGIAGAPPTRPTHPACRLPRLRESPHGEWESLSAWFSWRWRSSPRLRPC